MKKEISLVLSGGSARGLAHIGVIEELEKQGFEIKSIAGNSMGALVGAVYVMGNLTEFKKWVSSLDKTEVFKLLDFTLNKQGIIKGEKFFNKLKGFISEANIEDLNIPIVIVAGDITNMQEKTFDNGSLFNAVRASVSIPSILKPVKLNGCVLVDGGVVNPIPLNRVKRFDGDILVASYVNANIPYERNVIIEEDENIKTYNKKIFEFKNKLDKMLSKKDKKNLNYFSVLNKSTNLLTHNLALMNIEKYKPDLLINISRNVAGSFDFFKANDLIEAGSDAVKRTLLNFQQ